MIEDLMLVLRGIRVHPVEILLFLSLGWTAGASWRLSEWGFCLFSLIAIVFLAMAIWRRRARFDDTPFVLKKWIVTLKTGEVFEVDAINVRHAESLVVYGTGPFKMDGETGAAFNEVKIHRDNIDTVVPKESIE